MSTFTTELTFGVASSGILTDVGVSYRTIQITGGRALLYGQSNLTNWFSALANRATTPARILYDGDSYAEGYNVKTVGQRIPDLVASKLTAAYPTAGVTNIALSNYLPCFYWNGTANSYRPLNVKVGSPTEEVGAGPLLGLRIGFGTATGDGWTWTVTCSRAEIDFNSAGDIANAKASIVIDGGAPTIFDTGNGSGGNSIPYVTSIAADSSHTITVTRDASSTKNIRVGGIRVYRDEHLKGFHVYESGRSGYTASLTGSGYYNQLNIAGNPPHLAIIAFGQNEPVFGDSAATYETAVRSKITTLRGLYPTCSVLLVMYPKRGSAANSTQDAAWEVLYSGYRAANVSIVGSVAGVAFLDISYNLASAALSPTVPIDPLGYFDTDRIHPTVWGTNYTADLIVSALSPV